MELVMLGGINKEREILASLDQEHQEESVGCKIELFDPTAGIREVVDKAVLEKVKEFRKAKTKKAEAKTAEKKKFRNALMFTDIPATIKKAGFHPDGSPRVAIAGLFDENVRFAARVTTAGGNLQAVYRSDSLNIVFAETKTDWKEIILFRLGWAMSLASFVIATIKAVVSEQYFGCNIITLCAVIPITGFSFVSCFVIAQYDHYFTYLNLPNIGKLKIRHSFYTKVPQAPESVLSQITGCGPFAILFEVTQGWQKIKPDPVIFRVINIGGKQFFEPLVGYDMTPVEKQSLV